MSPRKIRQYTIEDVQFIHRHYRTSTVAEMAAVLRLSLFQVNSIMADLRKTDSDLPPKKPRPTGPVKAYVASLGVRKTDTNPEPAPKKGKRR